MVFSCTEHGLGLVLTPVRLQVSPISGLASRLMGEESIQLVAWRSVDHTQFLLVPSSNMLEAMAGDFQGSNTGSQVFSQNF